MIITGIYGKAIVAPSRGATLPQEKIEASSGIATEYVPWGSLITRQEGWDLESPLTPITNIDVLPTSMNIENGLDWDATGTYLAVTQPTTPFINIYKQNMVGFTKLPDPAELPTGITRRPSFDPTSTYLAVPQVDAPYINIYKRENDTFTKLPAPATLPPGAGYGSAWDCTGTYLAIICAATPYIAIYKREGDTFTLIPDVPNLTRAGLDIAFHPTGVYLNALSNNGTGESYTRKNDTFTLYYNLDDSVVVKAYGLAWDSVGQYIAYCSNRAPCISVFKKTERLDKKLVDPVDLPFGTAYSAAWDSTSRYLLVGCSNAPYMIVYKLENDILTKVDAPVPTLDAVPAVMKFDPRGQYLAMTTTTAPYLRIYMANNTVTVTPITKTLDSVISWGAESKLGVAQHDTNAGELADVYLFDEINYPA